MVKAKQEGPKGIPEYIDILSIDDKIQYDKLQEDVGSTKNRYNRFQRISTLNDIFDKIHEYCHRKEEDKWKRNLVCGICWFGEYLAINTRQLRFLISKSKSSINGALAKMGYLTVSTKGEPGSLLFENIPFLFGNQNEFRKWSIRKINTNENKKINKQTEIISITDEEDIYKDDINFLDEFFKNSDLNKREENNDFTFVNFSDNVDDNFDIEFGYDEDSCLSKCCNSYLSDENKEIFNNDIINYKFEDCTKIF